ncbi:cell division protein ZipA [Pseudoteredinibacter isoporae]|nr:cell division protein ZipA [Pseudoteredinibacter isoporae]NIB23031.1 cell division protein ZipA [Pseudoteredinibacter isoporae]
MQHVLTIIIVLLIVGVVLDGIRRMRQNRRDSIRMSLNMQHNLDREGEEEYGSELPNGGARVVNRDPSEADDLNTEVRKAFTPPGTKSRAVPEQVSLNLDEKVPMLMDSVHEQADEHQEPGIDESELDYHSGRREPVFNEMDSSAALEEGIVSSPRSVTREEVATEESLDPHGGQDPEEVIIINVMAPGGTRFQGEDLLKVLLSKGMRFGTMNIFHRHSEADGSGEILFSMANMVVPGTFDLDAMSTFETPGVSFFLTLPINGDSLNAFEAMVETTQALCESLGGELKDENRSVMTQQTIEHCRQRVREFARRQLSRQS